MNMGVHSAVGHNQKLPGAIMFKDEYSSKNTTLITVTGASTLIVNIDSLNVLAGDRIFLQFSVKITKGGTIGSTVLYAVKHSGTATVVIYHDSLNMQLYDMHPAGSIRIVCPSGIFKVTGSGTLSLGVYGISTGSNGTIAIGDAQIYAVFPYKQ